MAHLVIVQRSYSHPVFFKAGTPGGRTCISQGNTQKPGDDDLDIARYQSERIAAEEAPRTPA